jgi:hypothetical protein
VKAFRNESRVPRWLVILLVSLAGLLLEVGYTRIVSFKLWYYYTYLVIGLSLLGIGSGGVLVAISPRLRRATTERIVALCALWGALSIAVGYAVIAWLPVNTMKIWDYGTAGSLKNLALLAVVCFVLFATFIALGVIVATLLGRAGDDVGRLYFADLVGAGLACLVAVPLISRLGPPAVIALAALIFAAVGLLCLPASMEMSLRARRLTRIAAGAVVVAMPIVGITADDTLPDVQTEETKLLPGGRGPGNLHSDWGPVFRVDVQAVPGADNPLLLHDGTYGSGLWPFDGDVEGLTRYDDDPRSLPFRVLGEPPEHELIIGSAGGNEILASLYYDAPDIEAIELNPVTVSLLEDEFADMTGHLPDRPEVDLRQGDGRSYLARSDTNYDLVWYVAPDSYAATNAASSGAFVLSESYLYTTEMIRETLEHLSDDGIMVVQFGELDFEERPNRTSRYIVTARQALEDIGVDDPSQHMLISAFLTPADGDLSTIVVKRTPFTPDEVAAFTDGVEDLPEGNLGVYAPGQDADERIGNDHIVTRLAGGDRAEVDSIVSGHGRDIGAIDDDGPFFWHFSDFDTVLANILEPLDVNDPEDVIGERVLLLLLLMAIIYAALFLLAPFFTVRRQWSALPAKGTSAIYFAALGLGFMFFEISMIQRLVLFLGFPTYSLTVTLASILVSTGLGALLSNRVVDRRRAMPVLLLALAVLTAFYQLGLGDLMDALLSANLTVRVLVTLAVLAPLGLCLGMFMPLGLGLVTRLTDHGEEYVAWSWAVNGFFSVIGSVLTTILAMTYGFRAVQLTALAIYAIAAVAFLRLQAARGDVAVAVAGAGDGAGNGDRAVGEEADVLETDSPRPVTQSPHV